MNWFNKKVKRPELWGIPKTCSHCGWTNQSTEALKEIDLFYPPKKCPKCSGRLVSVKRHCPDCDATVPFVRIPKNFHQLMWGGHTCNKCGCEFDKWGRKIPA
jgi:predicted Zn-ribbon and HTH transcriptional regulator